MCYDIYSLWNLTGYLEGGIFILRINCLVYVQIFCNLKGKNKGLLQADSTQLLFVPCLQVIFQEFIFSEIKFRFLNCNKAESH